MLCNSPDGYRNEALQKNHQVSKKRERYGRDRRLENIHIMSIFHGFYFHGGKKGEYNIYKEKTLEKRKFFKL